MLNAAIVGLGRWGQVLVDAVQAEGAPKGERIRFARAVTRTPAKVGDYARRQCLTLGDDYQAALGDPAIDAVVLATPHSQHADQIVAAARAGKHVLVEKPFTLSKAGAERAVAACAAAGVVLAPGHNRRFLPSIERLKAMIDDRELGHVLHVEGNFSGAFGLDYEPQMWRSAEAESPAGGMTAMGIHTIDSMIHLFGPIAAAQALSLRQVLRVEMHDTTSMLLRFQSGMSGYLATMTATARAWRLQVFGTKGWVHLRDQQTMDVCRVDQQPATRTFEARDIERAELEAFAVAIAGGPAYPVPPADAVHGIAVLDAIVASAAQNSAVVAVAGLD